MQHVSQVDAVTDGSSGTERGTPSNKGITYIFTQNNHRTKAPIWSKYTTSPVFFLLTSSLQTKSAPHLLSSPFMENFDGDIFQSMEINPGAPSAPCGKTSAPHWRRHHRRWPSPPPSSMCKSYHHFWSRNINTLTISINTFEQKKNFGSRSINTFDEQKKNTFDPSTLLSAVDEDDTGIGLCGWLLTSISLGGLAP